MLVCVGGVEESERMFGKCEKGKVKECERCLLASVWTALGIYAWIGMDPVLSYARVTHHGIYLQIFVRYMTAICFLYKGILYQKC